jgi:hypothetical protein
MLLSSLALPHTYQCGVGSGVPARLDAMHNRLRPRYISRGRGASLGHWAPETENFYRLPVRLDFHSSSVVGNNLKMGLESSLMSHFDLVLSICSLLGLS